MSYPCNRFPQITSFLPDSASASSRPHNRDQQHQQSLLLSTAATTDKDRNNVDSQKKPPAKITSPDQQIADTKILRTLASYLWMKDNFEFRLRVIAALGFLVGAKVLNVQVPFLFKLAVDWLTTATTNAGALPAFAAANPTMLALFATPPAVLIGYGIARSTASAFNGILPTHIM